MSAWVSQLSRDLEIDTTLLGTRGRHRGAAAQATPTPGCATGWRAELVGEPIRRLVDGEAALAFDGHGGLVLEARSRQPLT